MASVPLRAVDRVQRHFGPRWGWVETVRRHALPPLDGVARRHWERPLIREKGRADYVTTVDVPPHEVARVVWPTYHRNVLSTKKYRVIDGERDWEIAAWRRVDPEDQTYQHHLYYFAAEAGHTDLYHHKEVNYEADPKAHESEPQRHGDPDGVLAAALEGTGLEGRRRKFH